jgi:hypothetical protein
MKESSTECDESTNVSRDSTIAVEIHAMRLQKAYRSLWEQGWDLQRNFDLLYEYIEQRGRHFRFFFGWMFLFKIVS